MKPADREAWIRAYLSPRQVVYRSSGLAFRVDVLTSEFVWAYLEAFPTVKAKVQFYGAPKCPTLGSDLSRMFRAGTLERSHVGLGPGSVSEGFPPWVWSYSLAKHLWSTLEMPK